MKKYEQLYNPIKKKSEIKNETEESIHLVCKKLFWYPEMRNKVGEMKENEVLWKEEGRSFNMIFSSLSHAINFPCENV